jgi:hypothetical protein
VPEGAIEHTLRVIIAALENLNFDLWKHRTTCSPAVLPSVHTAWSVCAGSIAVNFLSVVSEACDPGG